MGEETASLEVQGAGLRAKLSGISGDHILHFVIIVLLGLLIWKVFAIDKERSEQFGLVMVSLNNASALSTRVLENQSKIIRGLDDGAAQQEGTNYILTLSDSERKALKLTMPASLRKQVNGR